MTRPIVSAAIRDSFAKLHPRVQFRNPVMFVVYLGSLYTTVIGIAAAFGAVENEGHPVFVLAIAAWLWLTVLFANFAEAVAEGRGKAQAATLRSMRQHVHAKRLARPEPRASFKTVEAGALKRDDLVLVQANDIIPADGEVVEGVASVNESAVTGESAPVLREAGGDFSSVTGGTRVLSDWLVVRVTSREGEGFLDRMIALVEGAKRARTPNEIALSILLAMMTIVFLLATATLSAVLALRGRERGPGLGRDRHGARRAARLPDPDDDRRTALGDRHRGHGPHGARERDRDFRPRRRSRGRRRRAAARQDRHDHARRPARDRVSPGAAHRRARARGRGAARLARRRDAGRPLDRRAREGEVSNCAAATSRPCRIRSTSSPRKRA